MTTATDPTAVIGPWLYATLAGDATLAALAPGGVWEGALPQEQNVYPGIVFQYIDAADVRPMSDYVYGDCTYQVKVIDRTDNFTGCEPAAARVLALLDNASEQQPQGGIFYCQRSPQNSVIRYAEPAAGGVTFSHLGYRFRVFAR